nr:Bro-N domain-containing protein [Ligaoa zhengdingensis]
MKLVQSAKFGEIEADIYSDNKDMFMTINQLAECLGYANGRKGIDTLIDRNNYLKSEEFSVTLKMRATDGKQYNTRLFTEDGIYEVTMLSSQPKAKEFRAWIRSILKALRSGEAKVVSMSEYQRMMAQTREENARIRKAQILTRLADEYKGTTYQQVLNSHATKVLTGEHLIPLPELAEKTYSAGEIGERLEISANMVGKLANRHNLKTNEFGKWFHDKSRHSSKEVPAFRYYAKVIPVLQEILQMDGGHIGDTDKT